MSNTTEKSKVTSKDYLSIELPVVCEHKVLVAIDDYTGSKITIQGQKPSHVTGMFTYKKYRCAECQKVITVLNAVVED